MLEHDIEIANGATAARTVDKAVILARGLGKRMRSADSAASSNLAPDQSQVADTGVKAMIPIGRPFLDFVLSALADAGFTQACLVIGPEHAIVRDYYASLSTRRIRVSFAIQEKAIGTANAVLAAEEFAGGDSFIVLNSDNYYPVGVFRAMRTLGAPGLPAFDRDALIRDGNIPPERIRGYALLKIDANGYLEEIIEKPSSAEAGTVTAKIANPLISMNCWRFDSEIFRACREVPQSNRGEFELPQAVQYGIQSLKMRFKTVRFQTGVLDLSYKGDIAEVARRLAGVPVEL